MKAPPSVSASPSGPHSAVFLILLKHASTETKQNELLSGRAGLDLKMFSQPRQMLKEPLPKGKTVIKKIN